MGWRILYVVFWEEVHIVLKEGVCYVLKERVNVLCGTVCIVMEDSMYCLVV